MGHTLQEMMISGVAKSNAIRTGIEVIGIWVSYSAKMPHGSGAELVESSE
jgi:hypothetical protein